MLGYTDQHCNEKENISIYICNIIHVTTLEYTICVTQETLVAKKKKKELWGCIGKFSPAGTILPNFALHDCHTIIALL